MLSNIWVNTSPIRWLSLIFFTSAILTAFLGLIAMPILRRLNAGQSILHYVKEHADKSGTLTMGGIFIIIAASVASLLFCEKSDIKKTLVVCGISIAFMIVGLLDDFLKIRLRHNEGLRPYQKIFFQIIVAFIISVYAYINGNQFAKIPFLNVDVKLGWFCIPLYFFAVIAAVNCVNLTDGLDGLASESCLSYFFCIALLILTQGGGNILDANVVCALCFGGALFGFLFFNTNKAKIFMGDTGSLALGGAVSAITIFSDNIFYLPLIGFVFVLSGLSVILQVAKFKLKGKRIFLMAPIHHHFQMKGISECKIAYMYRAITLLIGLVCIIFS